MTKAQAKEEVCFRLSEQEYEGFLKWYKKDFSKEKDRGKVWPDMSNLKEECHISMDDKVIRIRTGNTDLWLLYSALTEIHRKDGLIFFFAQKEFWAVPERVLGGEQKAQQWFGCLTAKCREGREARIPLAVMEEGCRRRTVLFCSYTRTVDQFADACRALGMGRGKMQKLRRAALFPYRYAGGQLLALEEDGICEYGERSVARHAYGDFERAVYTPDNVYLIKGCGGEVIIPMAPLEQMGGMERLLEVCNERIPGNSRILNPKRIRIPAGKRAWGEGDNSDESGGGGRETGEPKGRRRGGRIWAIAGAAMVFGLAVWGIGAAAGSGGNEMAAAEAPGTEAPGIETEGTGLLITVPDDTVFDQAGADGTFVSSGLYYKIRLPQEEWSQQGNRDFGDILVSPWGCILVRGYREQTRLFAMAGRGTPRNREEYIRRMQGAQPAGDDSMPEVLEYTYRQEKADEVVRKEIRYKEDGNMGQVYGDSEYEAGTYRYSAELSVLGPDYFYTVMVRPREETPESIKEARQALDSFRILDTSAGICKRMEDEVFHGYYGKNYVMTNCLVLLEEDISADEIGDCLEMVKKIDTGFLGAKSGDALAARSKDSHWLGIDSQSLQENCTSENARKVSKIFKSDVILYDEYDGDLLTVAYSDKNQQHVYRRAASFNKEILESEFQCFGKEQEFPEDMLQYMDLTKEEAEAIWTDPDAVFQMDKWCEIVSHMTKMPVPEEFIGIRDYKDFKENFEIIRR